MNRFNKVKIETEDFGKGKIELLFEYLKENGHDSLAEIFKKENE